MTYRTVLVHVEPGAGDAPAVRVAAEVARLFGAELVGVGAHAFRPDSDRRLTHLDGLQLQALRAGIESELEQAYSQFEQIAGDIERRWWSELDDPDQLLIRHAAGADLVVAALPREGQDPRSTAAADNLILECGLPVLVVPPGSGAFAPERVLIGWEPTREARRAIADGLPFLKLAQEVRVVTVRAEEEQAAAEAETENVVRRLKRHGVKAEAEVRRSEGVTIGATLLHIAETHGAGLLVVGGYGHPRLRKWVLGGVTRELLAAASTPVLFSH